MWVFSAWPVAQIILLCTAAATRLTMSELTTACHDAEAIQAGRKPDVSCAPEVDLQGAGRREAL
jgi:hypothetical protein